MKKLITICVTLLVVSACANSHHEIGITSHKTGKSQISKSAFADRNVANTGYGCPTIGAIRWDAWYGNKDAVGKAETVILGPQHWHYRLPFCAEVVAPNKVKIDCATQSVMDKEIAFAKKAGIDYWAFVAYDPSLSLSLALKNYLSSTKKSDVNFSLILQNRWWTPKSYNGSIKYFINLMREPSYQKVAGVRPLIYLFKFQDDWIKDVWGTDAAFKSAIGKFRQSVQQSGLGNPYIVIMDFDPSRAKQLADRFGFDATSSYAIPGKGGLAPHQYEMLATNAERYWNRAKSTGTQVVPTVMTGWDHRPRAENPVRDRWKAFAERDKNKYYNPPTPAELGQHLKNALGWVKSNATNAQANTVIIYAWDEFSEGGWLAPTLSEGTARIDALGSVIRRDCSAKR